MADTKISADPAASKLLGPEKIPIIQSGANAVVTPDQIAAAVMHPGYKTGRWYCAPCTQGGSVAMTANTLKIHPIFIPSRVTISDLGIRVNTLNGNVRCGIWAASASTNQPTGTALGSVAIATGSTGFQSATLSTNVSLTPGLYWLGIHSDNSTVVPLGMNTACNPFGMGSHIGIIDTTTIGTGSIPFGYTASATYASGAPDLTSATFTEYNTSGGMPVIFFKPVSIP